jgi:DnaJ-class molecular chaperone
VITDPRDPAFIEPDWIDCNTCEGDGTVIEGEFDVRCPDCDGDGGFDL